MAETLNLTPKKPKLCIGSMSHRILIQKRTQKFLSGGMTYTFITVWERWAAIQTTSGLQQFSDIDINQVPSNIFLIRKIDSLTSEYWINYNEQYLRILSVEAVNDGVHQKLYCRVTGKDTKEGSKS